MLVVVGFVLLAGVNAAVQVPPFQLADRDGNGFVDQEEAVRAGLERAVFGQSDRNRDARLNQREYSELERSAGPRGSVPQ